MSYGKQNQSLVVKHKIGEYNVQIKNRSINKDDNDVHDREISSICMLPDGNVLLLDNFNDKLKKIDSSYNVVSYCDVPNGYDNWTGMCYIGDKSAVVCSEKGKIQYVNVSGKMKHKHCLKLDHRCFALACYGDTLYVRGIDTVYTYTTRCQMKQLLYNIKKPHPDFFRIAVSDGGKQIYITTGKKDLITINNKGNPLFTLKTDKWYTILDVCVVGDGTVLVLYTDGSVYQVDNRGQQIPGTVVGRSYCLNNLYSLCFDRQQCRLILAGYRGNCIYVFQLQHHNSETYMK